MSVMTVTTDDGRRTVRLYGQGWRVRRAPYGLIGLDLSRDPIIVPERFLTPAAARAIAAALTAAADDIEARP